jgi:PAS domain S-box-containing protein
MGNETRPEDYEALQREVGWLRLQVSELQRAAARHQEVDGVSMAEREELLRDAERVAHLGTYTWDVVNGHVTWSDELFRILGLEPQSITPTVESFVSRLHPEDRAQIQAGAARSARGGLLEAPHPDLRVVRPDGSIRYVTASTATLFDNAGVPRRIVGGVLDRTESLEAEAKLRRTLALL